MTLPDIFIDQASENMYKIANLKKKPLKKSFRFVKFDIVLKQK